MATTKAQHTRLGALALLLTLVPLAVATGRQPAAAAGPVGAHPVAYSGARSITGTPVVEAIDTVSRASVAEIPLPYPATAIAVTPDARLALPVVAAPLVGLAAFRPGGGGTAGQPVALRPAALPAQAAAPSEVLAINTATNALVPGVAAPVGMVPAAIAVTPDGSHAYVVNTFVSGCGLQVGCSLPPTGTVTPVTIGAGPVLTAGASVMLPNSPSPVDDAVTPDGKTLLVLTSDGFLDALALPGLGLAGSAAVPAGAQHIVVAPSGTTAYISVSPPNSGTSGQVLPITLAPKLAVGTGLTLPPNQFPGAVAPGALAIATTAGDQETIFAADSGGVDSLPLPSGKPGNVTFPAAQENAAANLAAEPDGTVVDITTVGNVTDALTGAEHPPGTLSPCQLPGQPSPAPAGAANCPPGTGPIAITPDQAPSASFSADPGAVGQPTSFDASASTITYGTIARYAWDFGDGSAVQTTTSPTVTHTYAHVGSYTVVLTETDWAGTSAGTSPPSTVFTGKTMTRRGGPQAAATRTVAVGATPGPNPTGSANPTPTGPGYHPRIALTPQVGPPGFVTMVAGSGFPPNTPLTLHWHPGIGSSTLTTDGSGGFRDHPELVFPRDQLGPRELVTQPYGVTATFLVVPPPLAPGDSQLPLELVLRG